MEFIDSLLYMLGAMSPYILLGFLIAGVIHAYVPQRLFAGHLGGRGWKSVVKAVMVGVPLPLCSCGVLPAAVALRRGGASRAASSAFLIATPQTGVDSIAATWSLLGPAFAVVRPLAAIVTAVAGGVAVGIGEKPGPGDDVSPAPAAPAVSPARQSRRPLECLRYAFVDLVDSIGGWLVAGLVIAALISVFVPAHFFAALSSHRVLAMLGVVVVAVPMYVCATGSIPIAMSLMMKGLSPGTALVLLMAGPAANFASFTLVAREMGRRAAWVYLASIVAGSVAFGLLIDFVLPASWFDFAARGAMSSCGHDTGSVSIVEAVCSVILAALVAASFFRKHFSSKTTFSAMTKNYTVKGMNCPHCRAAVIRSITGVEGVTQVEVDLATGLATVEGTHDSEAVKAAVRSAGFDVE